MKAPSGYVQQAFVGMANTSLKQLRSLAAELGFTPSALSHPTGDADRRDDLESLLA